MWVPGDLGVTVLQEHMQEKPSDKTHREEGTEPPFPETQSDRTHKAQLLKLVGYLVNYGTWSIHWSPPFLKKRVSE